MSKTRQIAIIGAGPAGLIAAETLGAKGYEVAIYEKMPSAARKFLMAGRGGLNLTHSENLDLFISRYGHAANWLKPLIDKFTPTQLVDWCESLGQETYIGSSGRIFPRSMKAAPLLRAWLQRLDKLGVKYYSRHEWAGWENDELKIINLDGSIAFTKPDAVILALGGASWPRLGSDGSWVKLLPGIEISELRPANCGFITDWSEYFSSRFAGTPLKSISISHKNLLRKGEAVITEKGIEGGVIYALSSAIRSSIEKDGSAIIEIDLRPDMSIEALQKKLGNIKSDVSFSNILKKLSLPPIASALIREAHGKEQLTAQNLAQLLKAIPVKLTATTGLARAISSAGGILLNELDDNLMLKKLPGVFAAGEMLDWEAPTGGYLLQACFATGIAAANGVDSFLREKIKNWLGR